MFWEEQNYFEFLICLSQTSGHLLSISGEGLVLIFEFSQPRQYSNLANNPFRTNTKFAIKQKF